MPEGAFTYDQQERVGEWSLPTLQPESLDKVFKLQGSIKLPDGSNRSLSGSLVASVCMKIPQYSFSGSLIEKVTCNLEGSSKDDATVFKGVKQTAFVRNLEFRL